MTSPDKGKSKFIPAQTTESVVIGGKVIRRGEPGYEEALRTLSERARTVEENSVEIDHGYQEEAELAEAQEARRAHFARAAEKGHAMSFEMDDRQYERGLLAAEKTIDEALANLPIERSLADDEAMEVLDAKEDALTRIRGAFRRLDPKASVRERWGAMRLEISEIAASARSDERGETSIALDKALAELEQR